MKTPAILSLFVLGGTIIQAQETKPNILYIMTDQQSFKMLSAVGNKYLKTPAMDKIAKNGYSFSKAYCVNPVSVPSRFALLTGHYGSEVSVRNNNDIPDKEKLKAILDESALGKIFRKGGYETLYGGKTHLPMAYLKGDMTERMNTNYGFSYYCQDDGMLLATETAQILKVRKKTDKPMFLFVSLMNPHDINFFWKESILSKPQKPANMSEREWSCSTALQQRFNNLPTSKYKKQIPAFPSNFEPVNDVPFMDAYLKFTDKERLSYYSWCYHRLTEIVDKEINVIMSALEKSGIADNTIIVFTSDHGDMNGSHQLIMKSRFYEESARIPFIFAGPGIKKGIVDNETLTSNGMDLIPTLCDLAGIVKPDHLTGVSLKPVLTGSAKKLQRDYLFVESRLGFMILDGRYKFALYDGIGNNELLTDTKADPQEKHNYAKDVQYVTTKNMLKKELLFWMNDRNLKIDPTLTQPPKDKKNGKANTQNNDE